MATIIELDGISPRIADDAFIAPTAVLIGDVTVAPGASIWFGAVLRGDNAAIVIGEGSNVQDNCVLHCAKDLPTVVGANVTVGHMAMLEGCEIGDGALIGMGATLLNGATVGAESLVGANALLGEGKEFPARTLILGVPAKAVRERDEKALEGLKASAAHYQDRARRYRNAERGARNAEQGPGDQEPGAVDASG